MFSKFFVVVLVLQVAGVLMAPAVEEIRTSVVGDRRVQDLLDSFSASKLKSPNKVVVTTTTTTTTNNYDNDQQLQRILRDPVLLRQLKEFLYHFLKLFNSINKGSTTQVVTSSENVDVESVLQDKSIRDMLYSLFNRKDSSSGLGDLLTQILIEEQNKSTPVITEVSKPIIINRNEDVNVETNSNLIDELKGELRGRSPIDRSYVSVVKPTKQVTVIPATTWEPKDLTAEELQQARNAKYEFATQIQDGIEGSFQQRVEIRDNGVVYGKTSYDDGNEFRTTYYQADADGYKITGEEVLPSKVKSRTGEANVQTIVNGNLVDYHITESDVNHPLRRE